MEGISSTTSETCPPVPDRELRPMVAMVFRAGLPAGISTDPPGLAAKQLAAVSTHWRSTSAPEQERVASPSPMWRRAVDA